MISGVGGFGTMFSFTLDIRSAFSCRFCVKWAAFGRSYQSGIHSSVSSTSMISGVDGFGTLFSSTLDIRSAFSCPFCIKWAACGNSYQSGILQSISWISCSCLSRFGLSFPSGICVSGSSVWWVC